MKLLVALFHPHDPNGPCLEILPSADDLDNFDEFHHFANQYEEHMDDRVEKIMVAFDPSSPKFTMAFLGSCAMDCITANAHAETVCRILKSHITAQ